MKYKEDARVLESTPQELQNMKGGLQIFCMEYFTKDYLKHFLNVSDHFSRLLSFKRACQGLFCGLLASLFECQGLYF